MKTRHVEICGSKAHRGGEKGLQDRTAAALGGRETSDPQAREPSTRSIKQIPRKRE